MKLSDFELGWLVGILEGEGHFEYNGCSQKVTVRMTDQDSIETAARLMRILVQDEVKTTSYMPCNPRSQRMFQVYVCGKRARKLMKAVVPYMSKRRKSRIWQSLNKFRPSRSLTLKDLNDLQIGEANVRDLSNAAVAERSRSEDPDWGDQERHESADGAAGDPDSFAEAG